MSDTTQPARFLVCTACGVSSDAVPTLTSGFPNNVTSLLATLGVEDGQLLVTPHDADCWRLKQSADVSRSRTLPRVRHVEFADWSDEEVDDHILGSGAFGSVGWLRDSQMEGYGRSFTYVLIMHKPNVRDGDDRPFTIFRFTRDEVRTVAREIALGQYDVADMYREKIRTNDVDAGTVDVIVQILAYGEVKYS